MPPVHLDTPYIQMPHTSRCPNMFGWPPVCVDVLTHSDAPYLWMSPYVWMPPFIWMPCTFGHPHMFGCPHMFGHPLTFGHPILSDLPYVWMPPVCLDSPIDLDTPYAFRFPQYVWMPPVHSDALHTFGHPHMSECSHMFRQLPNGNIFQPAVTSAPINPLWLKCFTAVPH